MEQVKLKNGFETEIDESFIDDMELFDALIALQNGNGKALPLVVDKVMGGKKAALYDYLRDERGRVPAKAVSDSVTEIIEIFTPKND